MDNNNLYRKASNISQIIDELVDEINELEQQVCNKDKEIEHLIKCIESLEEQLN